MATYVITHEVDGVEHWLTSPKREELFGPMGIVVRTFRDPDGSNKTALIAEIHRVGHVLELSSRQSTLAIHTKVLISSQAFQEQAAGFPGAVGVVVLRDHHRQESGHGGGRDANAVAIEVFQAQRQMVGSWSTSWTSSSVGS